MNFDYLPDPQTCDISASKRIFTLFILQFENAKASKNMAQLM